MPYSLGHTNSAYYYGTDYGRHTPYDRYAATLPPEERARLEQETKENQ